MSSWLQRIRHVLKHCELGTLPASPAHPHLPGGDACYDQGIRIVHVLEEGIVGGVGLCFGEPQHQYMEGSTTRSAMALPLRNAGTKDTTSWGLGAVLVLRASFWLRPVNPIYPALGAQVNIIHINLRMYPT